MAERQIPSVSRRPDGLLPTTRVTNELADAILASAPLMPHGQARGEVVTSPFNLWLVWGTGPNAEVDFSDQRYWLRRAYVSNPTPSSTPATPPERDAAELAQVSVTSGAEAADDWIFATNEAERPANVGGATSPGTHSLQVGQAVGPVWTVYDSADPHTARYVFNNGGGTVPAPQYPGEVLQGVAANTAGYGWIVAMAAVPT